MPAVSYVDFSGGLDRRLSVNSQDANKLWTLRNAYITTGKRIKKRHCLKLVSNALANSVGLRAVSGTMYVFSHEGVSFTPPTITGVPMSAIVMHDWSGGATTLSHIYDVKLFQGRFYVVSGYADGTVKHHYLDALAQVYAPVTITIASPGVVTLASHGLPNGALVRFQTTGSLPTGIVAGTKYYVVNGTANTFQLSASYGGSAINTTGVQSGTHSVQALSYITDQNCPHTLGIAMAASRIFSPSSANVRYCAVGSARDWTTASDAGFLPAGLEQDGAWTVEACGTFQGSLVVLFENGSQIWTVATDPAANALNKSLYGVGTKQPLSPVAFSSDMLFLSQYGFRSMTVQAINSRVDDNDVGVPIDSLVQPDLATTQALVNGDKVRAFWVAELGQYWAIFDMGTTCKAWVYSYSRFSKVASWSEYTFPVKITDVIGYAGKVYARDASNLYELSDAQYTDNGTTVPVEVQMAFQDNKQPGVDKQFWGADMVSAGQISMSFLYDPTDTAKETNPITVAGDTRKGNVLPVEVVSPVIAPIFRHSANEAMSIDALTMLYFPLTVT